MLLLVLRRIRLCACSLWAILWAARENGKKGGRPRGERYELIYSDGKHFREYSKAMTKEQATRKIQANVKRYFAGDPKVELLDWGDGYFEAFAKYPIADDDGHKVAQLSIVDD